MLAILGGVLVGAMATGVALAAVPDRHGVVHACYAPKDHYRLRILDTAKRTTCPAGQRAVSWNRTGPPGQDGAPGQDGTPGQDGVAGYTAVTAITDYTQFDTGAMATANCPNGTVPVGGGYDAVGTFSTTQN